MKSTSYAKAKEIRAQKDHGVRTVLVLVLGSFLGTLAGPQRASGQQYYNSFAKMVSMTSMWQSNFYSDIIRANAAKGSFKELADAPRITRQDIQNLCKPFPCGNESNLNPSPSQDAYPGAAPNRPPTAPTSYPITATDFRPVGGRIVPDEISRMSQGTAEEKELLRSLSNQFLDAFEKEGRKNNIANSFTFLTSISIEIVAGREPTDAEQEQLISGFNNSIAYTPQFVSMTARDKQVLHECAVVSGGMMAFLHTQGKEHNDAKMQADARMMAKAVLGYFFGVQLP